MARGYTRLNRIGKSSVQLDSRGALASEFILLPPQIDSSANLKFESPYHHVVFALAALFNARRRIP